MYSSIHVLIFFCVQYFLCFYFGNVLLQKIPVYVSQILKNVTFPEVHDLLKSVKTIHSRFMLQANTSRSSSYRLLPISSTLHMHISPSQSGLQLPPLLVIYSILYKQLSLIYANVLLDWELNNTYLQTSISDICTALILQEDHHYRHLNLLLWPEMQERRSLIACGCHSFLRE